MNGTTACAWDSVIPFNKHIVEKVGRKDKLMYEDEFILYKAKTTHESIHYWQEYFKDNAKDGMWDKLNKLIKPNGVIALFGSEPFSSALRMSNIKNYKYDWVWDKKLPTGHLNAKKQPLRRTENILIFYKKQTTYNPLMEKRDKPRINKSNGREFHGNGNQVYGKFYSVDSVLKARYPTNIVVISNANKSNITHATQKPVALMEYLIKTYTNEGDLVLDFTAGSFSTIVACANTDRIGFGIEKDEKYFNIGLERMRKNV